MQMGVKKRGSYNHRAFWYAQSSSYEGLVVTWRARTPPITPSLSHRLSRLIMLI